MRLLALLLLAAASAALVAVFVGGRDDVAAESTVDVLRLERSDRGQDGDGGTELAELSNEDDTAPLERTAVREPEGVIIAAPKSKAMNLEGKAALTVRVDQGGRQVPYRLVRATEWTRPAGSSPDAPPIESDVHHEGRTNKLGKVRFIVAPLQKVGVRVRRDDGTWSDPVEFDAPKERRQRIVRVKLPRTRPRAKTWMRVVSLPSGDPLEDVPITMEWPEGEVDRLDGRVTDEEGRVEVPWDPQLTYRVAAEDHTKAEVPAGEEAPERFLNVRLPKHARVHGRVVFAGNGNGSRIARGTAVELIAAKSAYGRRYGKPVRPKEDGSWAMESIEIPYGEDAVEVASVRLQSNRTNRPVAMGFQITPGADIEVVDAWGDAPPLRVRLVYPDGARVGAGASVALMGVESEGSELSVFEMDVKSTVTRATTDQEGLANLGPTPEGRWTIRTYEGAGRGGRIRFVGRSGTILSSEPNPLVREIHHDGSPSYRIVLDGYGSISGTVRTADGAPLQSADVAARYGDGDERTALDARTGKGGTFRFDLVPIGTPVALSASAGGNSPFYRNAGEELPEGTPTVDAYPGDHEVELIAEPSDGD